MKNLFTTIIILLLTLNVYSQANFFKFGIGVNAGLTTAYTGLSYGKHPSTEEIIKKPSLTASNSRAYGGSLDYYFTPFLSAGAEYNIVQLKDGPDKYEKQFISDFSSIEIRGNVALGQFVDFSYVPILHTLRTINLSLGFGVINGKNNVKAFLTPDYSPTRQHLADLGKTEFKNVFSIPATIGYNLNIYNGYDEVLFQLGVNYKMVYAFSDDLDGYNDDPAIFSNKLKDMYTTFGVSLKCMLGPRRMFYR